MVKTKNANVGKEGHAEEGGSSRGGKKWKGKQVARSETPLDKFILVQAAANYEEWTKKKRKIAPGHRVDLSDMGGHKSSITNMHSFVMLAMHEHRKMNFGYIAIELMLATQSSSTNVCPMVVSKVFQHFRITFFGPNDHIGIGKIYNQNIFKRMGFSRNEDGRLIRGGQEEDSENSKNEEEEEEEEGNEPEESDSETEVGRIRRETRRKKRQERTEEGSSSGSINQVMEMIASLQTSICTRLDALDSKMSVIQERFMRFEARGRDEGH
ncbi:hypothetical protein M9H77_03382 [Catharanthus roseus]|uniref:Uncharacterized protein n=1 Tax=Catharanthus roseus TaxID=4058 RepID=A0ACC0CBI6_CATRO|nr:hypothetical protein M9H77_03382 [Catharanthus roseus]